MLSCRRIVGAAVSATLLVTFGIGILTLDSATRTVQAADRCSTRYWVVGPNDTLSSIALAMYGNADRWEDIYAANRGLIGPDPNIIVDGTRLTIPPDWVNCKTPPTAKPTVKPGAKPTAKPQPPAQSNVPRPGSVYVVKAGDSLASIARAAYGNESQWERIYEANKSIIGAEPIAQVGQRLSIPSGSGSSGTTGTFVYVVRTGDSLASIARTFLGNESQWERIYELNREVIGPEPIAKVGQHLRVPGVAPAAAKPAAAPQAPPPPSAPKATPRPTAIPKPTAPPVQTYTVKAGDTLASIAVTFYGDPAKLVDIYQANKATIGPDPEAIKPGMVLVIPKL